MSYLHYSIEMSPLPISLVILKQDWHLVNILVTTNKQKINILVHLFHKFAKIRVLKLAN